MYLLTCIIFWDCKFGIWCIWCVVFLLPPYIRSLVVFCVYFLMFFGVCTLQVDFHLCHECYFYNYFLLLSCCGKTKQNFFFFLLLFFLLFLFGRRSSASLRLRRFKWDRDEICMQDCSSRKYASIASAGLLITRWQPWRHCCSEGVPGCFKGLFKGF